MKFSELKIGQKLKYKNVTILYTVETIGKDFFVISLMTTQGKLFYVEPSTSYILEGYSVVKPKYTVYWAAFPSLKETVVLSWNNIKYRDDFIKITRTECLARGEMTFEEGEGLDG